MKKAFVLAALIACGGEPPASTPAPAAAPVPAAAAAAGDAEAEPSINPRLLRRFRPVAEKQRPAPPTTDAEVALGRQLWFDKRLSVTQTLSCDSCHTLASFGVDGRATSPGHTGKLGRRNAPTVFNASEHFVQFWDGRAATVEEQAPKPMLNPDEMGMTPERAVAVLRSIPGYVEQFRAAFPGEKDPVTLANFGRAVGAFERGLTTRSRWDDYLAGKPRALSRDELLGLQTFLNVGCIGCHTGPQVGASMFQVAGLIEPWPRQDDLGRFEITKAPTDKMVFKVPTLKNIAKTAPYFHDGSVATLDEAVRVMGRHQLGVELTAEEVRRIVAFLGAFTGELPQDYIRAPALPADGPSTARARS